MCFQANIRVRRIKTAPVWCTSVSTRKSTSIGRWSLSGWSPPTCCECLRRGRSLKASSMLWELVSTQTTRGWSPGNNFISDQNRTSFIKFNQHCLSWRFYLSRRPTVAVCSQQMFSPELALRL